MKDMLRIKLSIFPCPALIWPLIKAGYSFMQRLNHLNCDEMEILIGVVFLHLLLKPTNSTGN